MTDVGFLAVFLIVVVGISYFVVWNNTRASIEGATTVIIDDDDKEE